MGVDYVDIILRLEEAFGIRRVALVIRHTRPRAPAAQSV